jgi:hypothetical protein
VVVPSSTKSSKEQALNFYNNEKASTNDGQSTASNANNSSSNVNESENVNISNDEEGEEPIIQEVGDIIYPASKDQ